MKLKNFTPEIMKNCLKMNMGVELETLRVTAAGEISGGGQPDEGFCGEPDGD